MRRSSRFPPIGLARATLLAVVTSADISVPAQQSQEQGLTESPQTPDSVLGGKLSSTRPSWQPSNGRNAHTEASALQSAPQPHTGTFVPIRSKVEMLALSDVTTWIAASSMTPNFQRISLSTHSSSERHQSELSNPPYTSFLDPTRARAQASNVPPSLKANGSPCPAPPRRRGSAAPPHDRLIPEELERRAISQCRILERRILGGGGTTLSGGSPRDAGHGAPRSENGNLLRDRP
ncbi:hypothetical protein BS47DRAFT_1400728 [Hydnum rufescens UP504]|uniref:Uncharacterized protein n=1 Tax=Hydnum rufescens UP504 TaxID=1448309 RepID=A0A9P6AGU7_9AGAM|nr:hypothetical protein BS47DRAFT_1400728 [Hydnum rufescens UP504]